MQQKSGILVQNFPLEGKQVLPAAMFHSGLVALVLLYSAFWFRLNLLQTLTPLALLVVFLAVSGYFLLSQLSLSRLKHKLI